MTAPDYMARFRQLMLENQGHADAMNEAASIVCGRRMDEVVRRTGNDPTQIDHMIDALIDSYVATCDGDERLALFGVLAMYGNAMYELKGAPGGSQ